jgi:integrase
LRDRALILLGLTGGFRRSEIVALNVRDVVEEDRGVLVTVRRSKTDQEGEGATVGILYARNPRLCAPSALRDWLGVRGAAGLDDPIFTPLTRGGKVRERRLTGEAVRLIVERHATAAGIDPNTVSPHSLRAGFATSAAIAGRSLEAIARHGRWRSLDMVLRYVRVAQVFDANPSDVF